MGIKFEELPPEGGKRSGAINMRLTPREAEMLKVIGIHTPKSQHQWMLDTILGPLEAEYKRIVETQQALDRMTGK